MKQILLSLFFTIPTILIAQDIEELGSNKSLDPSQWNGDREAYEITANNVLRSKEITTTYLSTINTLAYNSFWEFGIQLDFNPSAHNQLRIYLISDKESLKNPLNGYFIQLGETGDTDRYHLYKQNGEIISLLMSSSPKPREDPLKVKSRVKVIRDSLGKWSLYTAQNEEDFVFDGSTKDNEFRISTHFGIHSRFTSANSNKFQFDYFRIDTLAEEDFPKVPEVEDFFGKLRPDSTTKFLLIDTFEKDLSIWKGQTEKFTISQKRLVNSEAVNSPSFLQVPNTETRNRLWEVGLEVNGLLTTQNNVRLYLTATNDSLPGNQQGYYLQIDGTGGNHTYKLYRQNNATRNLLWQSTPFPTQENKLRARVRVTCTVDGEWRVYSDEYDHGEFSLLNDQNGISSVVDLSYSTSLHSGWMTRFSSTRAQDYTLHYFLIKELEDIPTTNEVYPYIVSSTVVNSFSIGLAFNKKPDDKSASDLRNYWLSPDHGSPIKSVIEGSTVIISFTDSLRTKEYELSVKHISDTLGNIMADTLISFYYKEPETVETKHPWQKLTPDTIGKPLVFDPFENGLTLWQGETEKFQVNNHTLTNIDKMKSPSFLRLPNTETRNRLWEVGLEVNGLLTTQNNVRLYLTATNDSLPGNQQGYYLQIDGTGGNHTYKLYRQNNATRNLLWQSTPFPTQENKLRARVRVTCTVDGEWRVYSDEYDHGEFSLLNDQNGISSVVDLSYSTSLHSGWMTRFSSTRAQDYSLHYILIKELEDLPAPIDKEPSYLTKAHDVIINEIMANSNYAIGLPEIEYVELKNLTKEEIDLRGWTYSSLTRNYKFQKGSIPPNSIIVLYNEKDSLFVKDFGNSIGLSPWPPLVNSGTTLTLTNQEGLVIDKVEYKTSWYRDSKKSKGGYSLERIDPYLRCEDDENWQASMDASGGTPGRENSVLENKTSQEFAIVSLKFINSKQLDISFNKKIDPSLVSINTAYRINNGMGTPDSVKIIDHKNIVLSFPNDFIEGNYYRLDIHEIADCLGNSINLTEEIFLAKSIAPGDILINEILADPFKDGVEFVEIYNNSKMALDLNTLSIGTVRKIDGAILLKKITDISHLMPPANFRLLSSNSQVVASQYPGSLSENFIQMSSFPQLANTGGTVVLMNGEKQIDRFDYNENMHDVLISNKKGVSLERIRYDRPTNEPGNFKSAAATTGYATPGYKNSQFREERQQQSQISLLSKTFSPDHDGFEDLLEINYSFQEEDTMINIEIYNDRGILIKTLHKNHRLASNGTLYWDGFMDNNELAIPGIYIVMMELYNSKGMRKIVKESCVLAKKF